MELILDGTYSTAKVFTQPDVSTISQIIGILNLQSLKNSNPRIMPDCHAGKGCVIGTTLKIRDTIIPNLVGVDIGCGMLVYRILVKDKLELEKLDKFIRNYIPHGKGINKEEQKFCPTESIKDMVAPINIGRAKLSLGSLGGGNHFIEINKTEKENEFYLVIHSGSRHLGVEVASFWQKKAIEDCANFRLNLRDEILKTSTPQQREENLKNIPASIPNELCHLSNNKKNSFFQQYLHDMEIAQLFASNNRMTIAEILVKEMGWKVLDVFETIHNYVDLENMILRKGAVSAREGEILIIPLNMRDGSLICSGKGNEDWNFSAPHGAGRLMSRSQAKQEISMEDFKNSMEGIFTSSVSSSTIDESPFAYKPMEEIIENIGPTVNILERIIPVYNFKAS